MKKMTDKILKDNHTYALADKLKKLHERLERDDKRFKSLRSVYMYYDSSSAEYRDNMILLNYSTRLSHSHFLQRILCPVMNDFIKSFEAKSSEVDLSLYPFNNLHIYYVGIFDKEKMRFMRCKQPKSIVDCSRLLQDYIKIRG